MGVHGLWKLIDKSGKPIPIETLENKVLAVDVSIWLYQLVRGFDNAARPGSNIFLLGLFHRICKLLFYRIRPIFVFDGGVPSLKKRTIAARQRGHKKARDSIEKVRQQLLENLIKQQALGDVLGERVKIPKQFSSKQDELFWLPPLEDENTGSQEYKDSDDEEDDDHFDRKGAYDFNSIDVNSKEFLQLPPDVRHEILTDLKESRKLNSWAKIHLMPEESGDFSSYQMGRLLKRRAVQVGLEKTEQELGVRGLTIHDLQNILTEQGVDLGQRIAADNSTRFIYASGSELKQQRSNTAEAVEEESEFSHSRINLSESSESDDDDISNVYRKMAKTENAGLSQQEILQLIEQQQNVETIREPNKREQLAIDRPGTSKESRRSVVFETSARPEVVRVNDQNLRRGKCNSTVNKDKSEVELENFPDFNGATEKTTTLQKDAVFNFNEGNDSESHPAVERSEEALENMANISKNKSNGCDPRIEGNSIIASDTKSVLEIKINLEEPIEEDIFADVFSPKEEKNAGVKSSVPDIHRKVEHTTLTLENFSTLKNKANISQNKPESIGDSNTTDNLGLEGNSKIPSNSQNVLEIKINLQEPIEEDIFADVFSSKGEKDDVVKSSIDTIPSNIPYKDELTYSTVENITSSILKIDSSKATENSVYFASKSNSTPMQSLESKDTTTTKTESGSLVCEIDDEMDSIDESINSSYSLSKKNLHHSMNSKELDKLKDDLERESLKLIEENKRGERLTSSITEEITQDAQYLLQLFGIPFLIAPMEAEAQCAYLDLTGQTDGTISDDSDIWLFGANNVYKNFFDQRKFVKQFKASDILRCYRLTREDLIMIAMLVGSDYTTGVSGVGPVNAIEIVANFPCSKSASTPHQRLLKFVDSYLSSTLDQSLLKKLKSIEFADEFPSDEVVKAYLSPVVDESKEKFTWSKPDMAQIRIFMRDKFGWDFQKTEKTLNPVFEKLSQSTTQKTIHNYFDWAFNVEEVSTVSKRVGKAVELMSGEGPSPSKKAKPTTAQRDPLQSNYSRRKFGKFQKDKEVINEAPVLEGSRAARAAAKATMAATKKPTKPPQGAPLMTDDSSTKSKPPLSSLREEILPKYSVPSLTTLDTNPSTSTQSRPNTKSIVSTAHLPSLSDILCGIEVPANEESSNSWTPSRDVVSQYAKRKYGKLNQSTSSRSSTTERQMDDQFTTMMKSKTPAQIAKERAARKLKEAKQRAIELKKSKK